MKLLVTGGAGFIGAHVTRMLLEAGEEVRVLLQPGAPTRLIDDLDVERVEGDLLDADAVRRAVSGCRELYHLAAIYALWHPTPEVIYRVNVEGTRNVMNAALETSTLEKVVHTSSIAAVGVPAEGEIADETTPFHQWPIANEYIMSKYVSELEVLDFVRRGLPAVIVNPAFPFGEGDVGPTPTGEMIVNALTGKVPGYLEGGFNAVYVQDVARGHLLAAEKGRVGERYLLAGHNITNRDFMRTVARVAGVRVPDRRLSPAILRRVAQVSETVARFTGKRPLATVKAIAYLDRQHVYFDASKARRELGYETTDLETAVSRAVEWFRANGYA